MTIHIISLNLLHIPESHWNERLRKTGLDLQVKYGYPEKPDDPVVLVDACMFLTEGFYQKEHPWAIERSSLINPYHRNTHGWLIEPNAIHPNHYRDIHKIKAAMEEAPENVMHTFDQDIIRLYQQKRVELEEAMEHADDAEHMRLKLRLGGHNLTGEADDIYG